jgi:hypothetical protein
VKIKLIVIPDSFCRTKSITGEIFFQSGDFCFPEDGWNDFVAIILGFWLRTVKNSRNDFELLFMDGPFKIKAEKTNENEISLLFLQGEDCVFKTNSSKDDFERQLVKAARKTLRKVSQEKWETAEIDSLREIVSCFV